MTSWIRWLRSSALRLLVVCGLVVASYAVGSRALATGTPSIVLSAYSGGPGTLIAVSGQGFDPNTGVTALFNAPTVTGASGTVDGSGYFGIYSTVKPAIQLTVPINVTGGTYVVSVNGTSNGQPVTVTQSFVVTSSSSASISLSLTSGPPGTSLTVTGSGFQANEAVTISLDSLSLVGLTANSSGAFSSAIAIPTTNITHGNHTVTAHGSSSGANATATFNVNAYYLSVAPTSVSPGTSVTVSGSGFAASETVTIYFNSSSVGTTSSDGNGNITFTFGVPTVPTGSYNVVAIGASSQASGSVSLSVSSTLSLSISPTSANVGNTITLNASGFAANTAINITIDGSQILGTTSSSSGTLSNVTFALPAATGGSHTIQATAGSASASALLTVNPTISLSATHAQTGASITVNGTGYGPSHSIIVQFDGANVGTTSSASNGTVNAISFSVPSSAAATAHTVTLQDVNNTGLQAQTQLTVGGAFSLASSNAAPGGSVSFSGNGFVAGETVNITLNGAAVATVTATSNGTISGSFTVPSGVTGNVTVSATGATSGLNFTASTLNVTSPLSVAPTSGAPGTSLTLNGGTFTANEGVNILFNGQNIGSAQANGNGTLTNATVTVPSSKPAGTYTIQAQGKTSNLSSSVSFAVTPSITVTPSPVLAGAFLTITGQGYAAGESVIVLLGGTQLGTANADSNGNFSVSSFSVPMSVALATYQLTAQGLTSHQTASAQVVVNGVVVIPTNTAIPAPPNTAVVGPSATPLPVLSPTPAPIPPTATASPVPPTATPAPSISVSPSSGASGSRIKVSARGLRANETARLSLDSVFVHAFTADATGAIGATTLALPAATFGPHQIVLTGAASGIHVTATFTVRASATLSPGTVHAGDQIAVTGAGFGADEQISATLNGTTLSSTSKAMSGKQGSFTLRYTIPRTTRTGKASLVLRGLTTTATVTLSLTVLAAAAPAPSTTWYFAAGSTAKGAETVAVVNPNSQAVQGTFTVLFSSGAPVTARFTVKALSRSSYDISRLVRSAGRDAGLIITTDRYVAVSRSFGGTISAGIAAPLRSEILAGGGSSKTARESLVILNPNSGAAHVQLSFIARSGNASARTTSVTVGGRTRLTVDVVKLIGTSAHGTIITADQPVVVERVLSISKHTPELVITPAVGVTNRTWLFAAGSTAHGVGEDLTVLNAAHLSASVTIDLFNTAGVQVSHRKMTLAGVHQLTIDVDTIVRQADIAAVVQASVPVVAEEALYAGSRHAPETMASALPGVTASGMTADFATGDTSSGHAGSLLLFNPAAQRVTLQATFITDAGQVLRHTFTINAYTRATVNVATTVSGLPRGQHAVLLRSTNGRAFVAAQGVVLNGLQNGVVLGSPAP